MCNYTCALYTYSHVSNVNLNNYESIFAQVHSAYGLLFYPLSPLWLFNTWCGIFQIITLQPYRYNICTCKMAMLRNVFVHLEY